MNKQRLTFALVAILILSLGSACGPSQQPATETETSVPEASPSQSPTTLPPTDTSEVTATEPVASPAAREPTALPAYDGLPLPTTRGELFVGSGVCTACHTDVVDEAGTDVSYDTDWRAAMMANAARDPYWQATVRSEALKLPKLSAVIEDKCATCHTPMARFTAMSAGLETIVLDAGFLDPEHTLHDLALDGVSCALCHQIEETGLGTPGSFSGGYSIDVERPVGERLIYGPFPAAEDPAAVMQDVSGYRPVQGPQTLQSELCATCHTLYTPYVDADGEVAGVFPEQMVYLEWQHSDYAERETCQDCHMPPAQGGVRLSSVGGGPPRSPFGQHLFVGGNTYVLRLLQTFGEEWAVTASSEDFERKIDQTLEQLQGRTATVTVEEAQVADSRLTMVVAVESQVGHKLPTGYPARRAWLHVTVKDATGSVIFESGSVMQDGSIVGNENDNDPATYEVHYEEIVSADQVQIYEAILENTEGAITTGLLEAKGYRKDNRLLPAGFD
ncbi:MAG: hypothetical protein PVF04_07030, partial [Anaerolineae bacterium]